MRTTSLTLLLAIGCTEAPPSTPADTDDPAPTTDSGPTTDTAPTDTSDTVDTGPTTPPFDCTIRPNVTDVATLDIEASEDFTIGTDGLLYGVQAGNGALVRTSRDGVAELLAPNVSTWGRGVRFLPGGDVVVAEPDSGALIRFDATTWGRSPVKGGLASPNGIAIGDDGFVYLTQLSGEVLRIDPDTGASARIHASPISTDGITFAPDYRTLYWNSETGEIMRAVLDDEGAVLEGPALFATIDTPNRLDGMTTDVCGNVYVVDMAGRIELVTPDGQQSRLYDLSGVPGGDSISAVNFGNGHGGFEPTKLYVMSLSQGVIELEVGVPGKWEPHWP